MTSTLNRRMALAAALFLLALPAFAWAQEWPQILEEEELTVTVPSSFYFEGMSRGTQMRNIAAVKFAHKRFVMAGLSDTSGYMGAKCQGFLITDSPIRLGGARLATGSYGFGITPGGDRMNVMDVGGRVVLSVRTRRDAALQQPRPLMMTQVRGGVRLYAGRDWVLISPR